RRPLRVEDAELPVAESSSGEAENGLPREVVNAFDARERSHSEDVSRLRAVRQRRAQIEAVIVVTHEVDSNIGGAPRSIDDQGGARRRVTCNGDNGRR